MPTHARMWHPGFGLACRARTSRSCHVEDCCARGTRRLICMKPRLCQHGVQVLRTAISVVRDVEGAIELLSTTLPPVHPKAGANVRPCTSLREASAGTRGCCALVLCWHSLGMLDCLEIESVRCSLSMMERHDR